MIAELDRLEERIAEAAETIRSLKDQNEELEARLVKIEEERDRYLEERSTLGDRISRLLERVDALRLEI